jgi:protein gp37
MAEETLIAWTDRTANFWMGCVKVSEGCRNCYAEKIASGKLGLDVWGAGKPRQVAKTVWQNVLTWNRAAKRDGVRRRVFCGSMMDWAEDHATPAAADQAAPSHPRVLAEGLGIGRVSKRMAGHERRGHAGG